MKNKKIIFTALAGLFAVLTAVLPVVLPVRFRIFAALICAAAAILFVVLRLWLNRAAPPVQEQSSLPPLEDELDIPQRISNRGYWICGGCLVLAVAMIVSSLPTAVTESISVNSRVLSGTLEPSPISSVLSATGTVAAPDTQTVELPQILQLEAYHVRSGQSVARGDILASVDKIAVNAAIVELQSVLDALDKDLASAKDTEQSTYIKSTTAGRVKLIYAQKGDSVAQTVYENGALMLISLDGFMALQIEAPLTIGTDVTVTLSDGKTEKGTVVSVSDGLATITIPDSKAVYGDTVTVTDENDRVLGTAQLYINSPLKVVGNYGTVANISVSLNQKVSAGTALLSLKETGRTAKYASLLERRGELEDQMDVLTRLAADGYVRAEHDGVVSGVDSNADYVSLSPVTFVREPLHIRLLADRSEKLRPVLLAGEESEEETPAYRVATVVARLDANRLFISTTSDSQAVADNSDLSSLAGNPLNGTPEVFSDPGLPVFYSSGSSWEESGFGQINAGDVLIIGSDKLVFQRGGFNLDILEEADWDWLYDILYDLLGIPRFSFNFSIPTTPQTPVYETYNTETSPILTITPQDEVTVDIQIDELDILTLHVGMEASITLDALQSQALVGKITHINYYGSNQGGNTKYTVEVTMPRTRQMLEGMNASVKIVTGVSQAVPTIPVAALQEGSGKTCIYTSYDPKTDTLGGLTQVETGISDGNVVEILSGMDENTTYYYRYADSMEYRFL